MVLNGKRNKPLIHKISVDLKQILLSEKKSDLKGYILYDSLSMTLRKRQTVGSDVMSGWQQLEIN